MDPRNVHLRDGDARWIFPALPDSELARIVGSLIDADETIHRAGQRQGADPDASAQGIRLNRLYYQRLGPAPTFPTAVLMAEGGHGPIETFVICTPGSGRPPTPPPGPPWQVSAYVALACDSVPPCPGHNVLAKQCPPARTPEEATQHILEAADWILDHAAATAAELREHDPLRGHAPLPVRRD